MLLVFGIPSYALAAGSRPDASHTTSGQVLAKARPGWPNLRARQASKNKLDRETARRRDLNPDGISSVIVTFAPGAKLPQELARFARTNGKLKIINGHVLDVPNRVIRQLEENPGILKVHYNRSVKSANYRTSFTVGSRAIQRGLGLTGAGVGVAVIDSGITTWHDDLTSQSSASYPYGNQRVAAFVDFVNGATLPYDDEGHGSHVAGSIAGNGYDSLGQQAGAAPGASLVSLKVLDANGQGTISNIIAALDWVAANYVQYNIRVVNLSVGATITESYWTDPLTLAAKAVVDAGVTVVSAAGNFGMDANGDQQYGGIVSPGNAPWVLTVGASSTNGTTDRADDTMAAFSSHGPTYLDWSAKPDLVAPGEGTVSLADPSGTFYTSLAQYLLPGLLPTPFTPYLSLSGTSMAVPVVSGTVALMLQANPLLTPNSVKAILQYTAQEYPGYDPLVQGAGFLNALGAVRLAAFFATAQPGQPYPSQSIWSKHIIWGNQELEGGVLIPTANAWNVGTTWGGAQDASGDNIVWGTSCGSDAACDNIVWGTDLDDNIVWGTSCGDAACDNIVWGTDLSDNIVWGTICGGADCDNIVWGADLGDNIVWGTDLGDNIVWGTITGDQVVWSTGDSSLPMLSWQDALSTLTDAQIFEVLTSLSGGSLPMPAVSNPSPDAAPATSSPASGTSAPAPSDPTAASPAP
jgi:serine protease AprX